MIVTVIARRVITTIPTLLGVATLVFFLGQLTPGDPAMAALGMDIEGSANVSQETLDRVREEMGLDDPVLVQYARWLFGAATGNFGYSYVTSEQVADLVLRALPTTLLLVSLTMAAAVVIGVTLGVVAAARVGTISDFVARLIAVLGDSTPVFWFAIVLLLLFAYSYPIFPMTGSVDEYGLRALVLPVAAIVMQPAALIARVMRASLLEVLSQDFIRTARAKGVKRRRVIWVHALRNAISPVITVVGFQLANLMGGAVVVESIFSLRGLGSLIVSAIDNKDILVLQGAILVIGVVFAITNLVVDIVYTIIDPRVRL